MRNSLGPVSRDVYGWCVFSGEAQLSTKELSSLGPRQMGPWEPG